MARSSLIPGAIHNKSQHANVLPDTRGEIWFQSLPDYNLDTIGLPNNLCAQGIITNLITQQNSIVGVINELFGETTKFNISFGIDPLLSSGVYSRTTIDTFGYISVNGQNNSKLALLNIRIKLNANYLANATKMAIAQNIIHEMIHAYFFYRERDISGDPVKQQKFDDDFTFLKPFINGAGTPPGGHHEEMAKNFIDKIATILKEYKLITLQELQQAQSANQALAGITIDSYYKAMAWAGLQGTNAWKRFELTDPQTAQLYLIVVACESNNPVVSVSKEKC